MITNSADPDEKPRSVASHLGIASSPLSQRMLSINGLTRRHQIDFPKTMVSSKKKYPDPG